MKRKEFLKQSFKIGTGLALLPSALSSCNASPAKLTILHTNDMHSRIEPFPANAGRNAGLGGMARRAAIIEKVRKEERHVLLLDSGDIFQGTPYFNFFGGELEFDLMSKMGYDASTMGNHDFDNGLEGFDNMLPKAKFPFLTANYNFNQTLLNGKTEAYKVFQKGPLRIGVFGLGIELTGLVPEKLFGKTTYQDPKAIASEMVQELKSKGCDYIICLSHLGYKYESNKVDDHKLAEAVNGIDLILGGHTHTFLEKPTKYVNKEGFETIINQVGWAGINLGRIDVNFSIGGEKQMTSNVLPVIA